MNYEVWRIIKFRDAYELCKKNIQSFQVEFWPMWDMLLSNCERLLDANLVRIDFITDGYLPMPLFRDELSDEEFDYNCLFNLIINEIRRDCLSHHNWIGNEVYVDMSR